MFFGSPFRASVVLSDDLHWDAPCDRPRPGYHILFLTQRNGKTLKFRRASKTTNEAVSIMQILSLERRAVIQGCLSSEPLGRTSIRGTTGYDTDLSVRRDSPFAAAGQITWIESLLRLPSRVYYVIFQRISITENDLLQLLQSSPFLTALVVWEPVDSDGNYLPIMTDNIINRLVRRDTPPDVLQVTAKDKTSIETASRNILPNLSYLELSGSLAFGSAGLIDMLKSRCSPSYLRTGIGLVPDVQLQSLCLHFREAPMDRPAYEAVRGLFAREDQEVFIYEDNNPEVVKPMEEEELNRELSVFFDTYIDPDAYIAS